MEKLAEELAEFKGKMMKIVVHGTPRSKTFRGKLSSVTKDKIVLMRSLKRPQSKGGGSIPKSLPIPMSLIKDFDALD